jgi:hypothetical protein
MLIMFDKCLKKCTLLLTEILIMFEPGGVVNGSFYIISLT